MKIAYIGNFKWPHTTENEVLSALAGVGHDVRAFQEDARETWEFIDLSPFDLLLWTRTGWDPRQVGYDNAEQYRDAQRRLLRRARVAGKPVVGFHLDRWWGLPREEDIAREPFFTVDLLVTADGGHRQTWADAGINHRWMPPGVGKDECERVGRFRREFSSRVAFIGSWESYHPQWKHRFELVQELRGRGDCVFWPPKGQPAVRGQDLCDLIASVTVVVGDSCLLGGVTHYCSDRIPETLGRGGVLLHPHVEGITDGTVVEGGTHLWTWTLGDWDQMHGELDRLLADAGMRRQLAEAGKDCVYRFHTYHNRMMELLLWVNEL